MADNNIPTQEEVDTAEAEILAKRKNLAEAMELLQNASNAYGAIGAEWGNSLSMQYTVRETGEVRQWGVSQSVVAKHQAVADEAIAKAIALIS